MRQLIVLMGLLLPAFSLAASTTLIQRINQQLQHPSVLRGQFEQQRILDGFSKPMTSRGHFVVVRDRGVLWNTDTPFASQLIVTHDSLVQKNGNNVTQKLDANKEPALKAINGVLFALLSGDLAALEQRFTVTGEFKNKNWSLLLIPREAGWKQVLTRVELQGNQQINQLKMLDANHDATEITFFGISGAKAPSAEEASAF